MYLPALGSQGQLIQFRGSAPLRNLLCVSRVPPRLSRSHAQFLRYVFTSTKHASEFYSWGWRT